MTHHAQLLVGDFESSLAVLDAQDRTPSADVAIIHVERFGIDDARSLKQAAYLAPVSRNERVFVISFSSITTEAQNALLKLFEEPPHTARFYIISAQETILLPTLRSRLHRREGRFAVQTDTVEAFVALPIGDRLTEIAARHKKKDIAWFDSVLAQVESFVQQNGNFDEKRAVLFVRQYSNARSASKKMLLEHLAFSVVQR